MSRMPHNARVRSKEVFGILEWFHFQDYGAVDRALADLQELGVGHLRTGISWADWMRPGGADWIAWLFERFAAHNLELLPCFLYTPPSLGEVWRTSSPPRNLGDYADFVALMIEKFGDAFQQVELWNEPNNLAQCDFGRDPDFSKFAAMIIPAARWAKKQGKKTVLGGMSPIEPGWLEQMIDRGVLEDIDVLGIHGFPGTWEKNWNGWAQQISELDAVLERRGLQVPMWITEVGYSTRDHRQYQQLEVFLDALDAPCERMYWYGLYDLAADRASLLGHYFDEREYHCGLKHADGRAKLLYRVLATAGEEGVRETCRWAAPRDTRPHNGVLITGGAGFVGCNLAFRLLSEGRDVVVFDNLSRPGVERNLRWLIEHFEDRLWVINADIRDAYAIRAALEGVSEVFHFAGQTAVTASLEDPIDDFTTNARGTLNLLEEIRRRETPPTLVFTSTNKVYGDLGEIQLEEAERRYQPVGQDVRSDGIDESRPLDLYSPYGCSKGVADQYVLDYARTFGIRACVFRMSCIYGPRQMGTEDQGWVAHFLMRALAGEPITIYGDGKQVRDVLFVDDLVDAFVRTRESMAALTGRVFNIGGGAANTMSLLEFLGLIERTHGSMPAVSFAPWRPGDQRYFVSDTSAFCQAPGWQPRVRREDGVQRLYRWLVDSRRSRRTADLAPDMPVVSSIAPSLRSGGSR